MLILTVSMSYSFFSDALIWALLDLMSTMKTSVLFSSIFFMALSVLSGWMTILCSSRRGAWGMALRGYLGARASCRVLGRWKVVEVLILRFCWLWTFGVVSTQLPSWGDEEMDGIKTYTLEDRLGGGVGLLGATYIVESISNRSGSELAKSAAAGCNRRDGEKKKRLVPAVVRPLLRRAVSSCTFLLLLSGRHCVGCAAIVVEPGLVVERDGDEVEVGDGRAGENEKTV